MAAPRNDSTELITPFPEAVLVSPVFRSTNLFTANVPRDWCGTPAAHGGYLQALVFSAARAYFQTKHPARNQPDPVAGHTQFIKRVWPGPVSLSIKPVTIGSRVSVVQIELSQSSNYAIPPPKDAQREEFVLGVIATVTQGNHAMERGLSLPTVPKLRKEDIPDREKDCRDVEVSPFLKKLAPSAYKLDGRVVKGGIEGTYSAYRGRSTREIWYKFADGSAFDVCSLGYVTDMFGATPNNYVPHNSDYAAGVVYPTLSMATEIKKDPKNSKWLFLQIKSHEIKNGRFDTDVTVLDEEGELVALSKHVSLALNRQSPEEMKKMYRL